MPTTTAHRDRLAQIRERTHNARQTRNRARQTLEAANKVGDADGQAVASLALEEANIAVETSEALENQLLSSMAGVNGNAHMGEGLFGNPEVIRALERKVNDPESGKLDLGNLMSTETLVQVISSGDWGPDQPGRPMAAVGGYDPTSSARTTYFGPVAQLRRSLSILDVLPVSPTDQNVVGYTQETGDLDTGAAETAEGAVAPEAAVTFIDVEARVRKIADYLKATREQLQDVATLATILSNRLTYLIARRLERQVLVGDGVGENILGIVPQAGLVIPRDPAKEAPDMVDEAITQLQLAEADPSVIVLHPRDWQVIKELKNLQGNYVIGAPGEVPTGSAPQSLWQLPVVVSPVLTEGTAVVMDAANAATLFLRAGVELRTSDADQDDFVRGRMTFYGSTRATVAVWRPQAVAIVGLIGPGTESASPEKSRATAKPKQ